MTSSIFVGRRDVIGRVVTAVDQRSGVVLDLVGPPGSGRTSLLRAARQELAGRPDSVVVALDASLYTAGSDGPTTSPDSGNVARLLEDLREQIGHGDPGAATDAAPGQEMAPTVASVAEQLRACASRGNLVLIVDDVSLLGPEVRTELYRVVQRLGGQSTATTVLVRTAGTPPPPQGLNVQVVEVPPLRREDVAAYLEAASVPAAEDCVHAVYVWSAGYPPAVVAAADRLRTAGHGDFTRLARHGVPVPAASAVLRSVDAEVRTVIDVAAVLRTATITDLLEVLDLIGTRPRDDLATALEGVPLLMRSAENTYAFPPFLREHIARELRNSRSGDANSNRFDEINEQAVRHYRSKLKEKLSDPGSVYASWERLEHSETQHLLLEFAYHGGLRRGSAHARFPLASVFFDVVWWWAWYVDSPFLRQLLDAWGASARGDEDREFVAELERFRASYVAMIGEAGDRASAAGAEAAAALSEIRRILELGREGASNRHVLAITSALLGDARRKLDLHDPRVDENYASALADFRENGAAAAAPRTDGDTRTVEDDAWCVPWMLLRQAELALERGTRTTAQTRAHEALHLAMAPWDDPDLDFEVIANCHRVLGDALLDRDPAGAFREFVRVVFAAYAFHATPLPDEYTRRFHREQVQAVITRFRKLAGTDARSAATIADEIATWGLGSGTGDWPDLLSRKCWDELQTLMFPREPWPEELDRDSAYCRRVRVVREALGARLLEPTAESRPATRRLRRLIPWRTKVEQAAPERIGRFGALNDPAVEVDRFAPEDDQCWPRWWLDESAPVDWPDLDRTAGLPRDLEAAIRTAVSELPPLRRQVLELRDVRHWTRTAVSRELGISEDDQLLMLHRARSAIRRALDRHIAEGRTS